jgi:flagellar motor switch protein FliN/FliY
MSSKEVTRPIHTGRGEPDRRSLLQCLPAYSRSLLKIPVPVTVTLAKSRQPVRNIVDLVPGSILQFNKTCDETLILEVGNQPVAEGETVKVGDKFGLRVTSMVMPDERFHPVAGPDKQDRP